MKYQVLGALIVGALMLVGCTVGSGRIVTEERAVGAFDSIDVESPLNVKVVVDAEAEPAVTVTYDDNLVPKITTEVRGRTLVVGIDGSFRTGGGGARAIRIVTNELTRLEADSAAHVDAEGTAGRYTLNVSGAADIDLRDLVASEVDVSVSGASEVRLHASSSVTGEVSGASDVKVYGRPANVRVDSSGASDVEVTN